MPSKKQLRQQCADAGLATNGNKGELGARLAGELPLEVPYPLKVLEDACKRAGLPPNGSKPMLMARLTEAGISPSNDGSAGIPPPDDDSDEKPILALAQDSCTRGRKRDYESVGHSSEEEAESQHIDDCLDMAPDGDLAMSENAGAVFKSQSLAQGLALLSTAF